MVLTADATLGYARSARTCIGARLYQQLLDALETMLRIRNLLETCVASKRRAAGAAGKTSSARYGACAAARSF